MLTFSRLLSARKDSLIRHMSGRICLTRRIRNLAHPSQASNSSTEDEILVNDHIEVPLPCPTHITLTRYTDTPRSTHSRPDRNPRQAEVSLPSTHIFAVKSMREQEFGWSVHNEDCCESVLMDRHEPITLAPLVLPEESRSVAAVRLPSFKTFDREELSLRMTNLPPLAALKMLGEIGWHDSASSPLASPIKAACRSHSDAAFKPYKGPPIATRVE